MSEQTWTAEETKAHRKLWIDALRSGKYEQAKGGLRRGDAMCCLGVACDISTLGSWIGVDGLRDEVFLSPAGRETMKMPDDVRAWLGLTDAWGALSDGRELYQINDTSATFAEIADIIEAEPEGLVAK